MTKETSKNTSTRKKAPVKGDILAQEHGFSESGQTFIISQLASLTTEMRSVRETQTELKTELSAVNTRLTTIETEVKSRPTFMQMITSFGLISGLFAGLIIAFVKL